jgi:hypothetical protein
MDRDNGSYNSKVETQDKDDGNNGTTANSTTDESSFELELTAMDSSTFSSTHKLQQDD